MKMMKMMKMMMLLALCCSVVGGASELAFLTEPGDVIAARDCPLLLDCQVEGEGPISITWRRNGVSVATGVKATVLSNGTLLIRSFSKRRGGETDEFDCAAENRFGRLVSRKAHVQLASLPKFLSHPESVAVDEGGVARLTCQVNGIPEASISWQKDQQPLSTEEPRYILLPGGVLQVTSVRRSDSGSFRCVASNIANTRFSHEAQLAVTVAGSRTFREPVILSGPQNLTINVHQTAVLECIASGNPSPIVSWSRLDGRSIGVEGIAVLGGGNLMISDASLLHSGIYVCSANRPGSRTRRTATGHLVVQAPPEFSQWPQSLSRPGGGSAEFSCSASGEPQPHIIWLKNGKLLSLSGTVRLSNGNTTLFITQISPEDEAIYQCIAENSAGSNQASARLSFSLSILQGPDPPLSTSLQGLQDPDLSGAPAPPSGLQAEALAPSSLTLSWERPPEREELHIIGYVLHVRRLGEPDSAELQEAVSKNTFSHDVQRLEPSTTYSVYLKAYSTQGGSRQSSTITCTTQGGVPSPPSFFSKVLNQTALQVLWELPGEPGMLEGFRLEYRGVSNPEVQGQETFPAHINTHTLSHLERLAVYEIRLLAFNGNGDGPSNRRLVSLSEGNAAAAGCECSSGSALLVGVHSALACVLCCLLLLGYRRSFLCRKSAGWEAPPTLSDVKATKGYTPESMELSQRPDSAPPVPLMVETVEPDQPGTSTG